MTSQPRFAASQLPQFVAAGGRLFITDEPTPCRTGADAQRDLWFSPYRDRERAARQCQQCPFIGRCGYNAVAARATHGVWAGQILPGDKPAELEPIYERLLAQYERRREVELGGAPPIAVPGFQARRRHRNAA